MTDFSFGNNLAATFGLEKAAEIAANKNLIIDGKTISIFDLTEEKDSDEAIGLLMKYI
jgi:hypothetical protein